MALRVRVGVSVYVLAGSGMCGTMCACLLLCVRVSGLMCHSVEFIFDSKLIDASEKISLYASIFSLFFIAFCGFMIWKNRK